MTEGPLNELATIIFYQLGRFERRLLRAIDALGEHAYCKALSDNLGVTEGQTSRSLAALKKMGMLSVERVAPRPVQGGRSKLVYSLTESGKHVLLHGGKAEQRTDQAGADNMATA